MDGFWAFLKVFSDPRWWCLLNGGAIVVIGGCRLLLEERLLDRAVARDRKLRGDLVGWGVVGPDDDPALVRQVYRCERRLTVTAALISGLVLVLVGAVLAVAEGLGRSDLPAMVGLDRSNPMFV